MTTPSSQEKLKKQQGTTAAERYLARLCERTFLSLWSYPNVFRDVCVPGTKIGKEICDLLVIFEDRVLIFSDKDCAVPRTGDLQLDWSRWFRKAVLENTKQAHGAERWLRQFPNRLFLYRSGMHKASADRATDHRTYPLSPHSSRPQDSGAMSGGTRGKRKPDDPV